MSGAVESTFVAFAAVSWGRLRERIVTTRWWAVRRADAVPETSSSDTGRAGGSHGRHAPGRRRDRRGDAADRSCNGGPARESPRDEPGTGLQAEHDGWNRAGRLENTCLQLVTKSRAPQLLRYPCVSSSAWSGGT